MDITGVNRTPNVPALAPKISPDQAAENRSIARAVKALNKTETFGQGNHLEFHRDPESKRMVIQVINGKTREVVLQIPAEYVLRLAEDLERNAVVRRQTFEG